MISNYTSNSHEEVKYTNETDSTMLNGKNKHIMSKTAKSVLNADIDSSVLAQLYINNTSMRI